MYKQGDACPLCGAGLLSEKVVAERFNYKGHSQIVPDFRILDLFPESLGVLPGVPRPLAVALRKGKRVEAGVVCEDDEGYAEFRGPEFRGQDRSSGDRTGVPGTGPEFRGQDT